MLGASEELPSPQPGGGLKVGGGQAPSAPSKFAANGGIVDLFGGAKLTATPTDWFKWSYKWVEIPGFVGAPCAPICAISMAPGRVDLFAVGIDGHVYQATRDTPDSSWFVWAPQKSATKPNAWSSLVPDFLRTVTHAPVAAVSRWPGQLEIFVTDVAGRVCCARWRPLLNKWDGWFQIAPLSQPDLPPGAPVAAVSRSPIHLEIFVVGFDGAIYTAETDPNVEGEAFWVEWVQIAGSISARPGSPVTALSYAPGEVQLFVAGEDKQVQTIRRVSESGKKIGNISNDWDGWQTLGGPLVGPRSRITAVSRSEYHMDVFAVHDDGVLYSASWQLHLGWGGWFPVGLGRFFGAT